jgi:uncharacterized damage-inducible protein DinB
MDETLKPIAEQLAFNSSLLSRVFEGMDDASASTRPHGSVNSVKWLAGHVVTARCHILSLLGQPSVAPWNNVFEGQVDETLQLPSIASMQQKIEATSSQLLRALATASRRTLMTAPASPFPTVENTSLAAIAFLAHHEAYHVGQLSYARRILGLPGLVQLYSTTA